MQMQLDSLGSLAGKMMQMGQTFLKNVLGNVAFWRDELRLVLVRNVCMLCPY